MKRQTRTGLLGISAYCNICSWSSNQNTAQGSAAQHHDRTGHTVQVEITRIVIYGP